MELESRDLDKIKLSSWPSQFRVTLQFEELAQKKSNPGKLRDRTKEKVKDKKDKKARKTKTEQTEKG